MKRNQNASKINFFLASITQEQLMNLKRLGQGNFSRGISKNTQPTCQSTISSSTILNTLKSTTEVTLCQKNQNLHPW